jgi:hypothetical protein
MAITGLVICWSVVGGVICGIIALVIGINARSRAMHGEATNGDVATAGIALGALAVVVSLTVIPVWVRLYHDVDVNSYVDCVSNAPDQQGARKCADGLRKRGKGELGVTVPPTR